MGEDYETASMVSAAYGHCSGEAVDCLFGDRYPNGSCESICSIFLWMLTLVICIGTVGLCASGAEKPLGWVIVGAFIGSAVCLCEVMGLSDTIRAPKLFFGLYLLEFLLSTSYGICRRFHVFV